MTIDKDLYGYLAMAVNITMAALYMWRVHKGRVRPHIFTWVIWSLICFIAGFSRVVAHAGPGAWGQLMDGCTCIAVVALALYKGEHSITRTDIAALVGALSAIPAWFLTHDPLVAVVIVTIIDVVGYYPTFRKTYYAPHHEAMFIFIAANVVHVLSVCATVEYSLTTMLVPVVFLMINSVMIGFIIVRRVQVPVGSYR